MASVVIAAHNEAATIGRCLDALMTGTGRTPIEVVVAANGCTDDTVGAARRPGIVVVELPQPGKSAALNAAERVAMGFPRLYLDADMRLTTHDVDLLARALERYVSGCSPLAVAPARRVDVSGRPALVVHYYRLLDHHPAFAASLFGRGAVMVSARGRGRFREFPELLGDDFFLDSLFTEDEKRIVEEVVSVVAAPSSSRMLLRRLARVRRGNGELRSHPELAGAARTAEGPGWLIAAVRREPSLAPSALVYVLVTVTAILAARWGRGSWGHDRGNAVLPAVGQETPA